MLGDELCSVAVVVTIDLWMRTLVPHKSSARALVVDQEEETEAERERASDRKTE